jgi:hypothetical protein
VQEARLHAWVLLGNFSTALQYAVPEIVGYDPEFGLFGDDPL